MILEAQKLLKSNKSHFNIIYVFFNQVKNFCNYFLKLFFKSFDEIYELQIKYSRKKKANRLASFSFMLTAILFYLTLCSLTTH